MACDKGHALIRVYDQAAKLWFLACVHCSYRIQEG